MISRIVNAIGFWSLAGLACAMFFAAILAPQIRSYRQIVKTEKAMKTAVENLKEIEKRNAVQIEQLKLRDPILIARMARQQLGYKGPAGNSIPVAIRRVDLPASLPDADQAAAASLTAKLNQIGIQLPKTDLPERMGNPDLQLMMLVGSGVSMVLAFLLFGWWGGGRRRAEIHPNK